ncbi:polymorphic toxin-type HINT domain-containing protein [Nocardioides sp. GCM10030258]|uniref:polymorphic toxin-type HINT domain-containing protein n=1 Tax=unclassified Nocardioides TaxID=2615069 RepID=UPI0036082201
MVLATDPETGEQVAKAVTHLWIHHDDLTDLILDVDADGDGAPDRLVTTEDHPFWNATDPAWQGPEDFTTGDEVIDEQWNRISVVGLDPGTTHRDLAYNLTVEDIHTYHVSTADVLVHNTGCGSGGVEPNDLGKAGEDSAGSLRTPRQSTSKA